jgi:CopG family transcriptional regulator, nickel-responsive regulator
MDRFTISLDDTLAASFDKMIARQGYANRSEAVRDLIRARLQQEPPAGKAAQGECVASLSYVYNHHERELAERLATLQHGRHDLIVSSMHVHLDHDNCLESVVLQGSVAAVQEFGARLTAEAGVRHGQLNLVRVEAAGRHAHGAKPHSHRKPRT